MEDNILKKWWEIFQNIQRFEDYFFYLKFLRFSKIFLVYVWKNREGFLLFWVIVVVIFIEIFVQYELMNRNGRSKGSRLRIVNVLFGLGRNRKI